MGFAFSNGLKPRIVHFARANDLGRAKDDDRTLKTRFRLLALPSLYMANTHGGNDAAA
jgi:hypothetical protein